MGCEEVEGRESTSVHNRVNLSYVHHLKLILNFEICTHTSNIQIMYMHTTLTIEIARSL